MILDLGDAVQIHKRWPQLRPNGPKISDKNAKCSRN